ncbi:MSF1-domain-containing protein [Hysterangium stoloniferum]|nr:MSF1-domain-containing protein [Hysterangium stoloniferum]
MHFFKTSFDYDHPWRHVQVGIWHKYPNPHCSHVLTVDVLDRSVDPRTGVVRTERILGCKQKAPVWIVKLLGGSEDAFVREVTFVDPVSQRTSIVSTNMSMSQYVTCLERIHYTPDASRPLEKTRFSQTAEIQTRMPIFTSLANRLERWSCERFGDNARLGRMGFEFVLRNMWESRSPRHVEQ